MRPHLEQHFGQPIRRFYETGEITEDLMTALGLRADLNADTEEERERLLDVVSYVREAGERPPVTGWADR